MTAFLFLLAAGPGPLHETSSREEIRRRIKKKISREEDAQIHPCDKAVLESRMDIVRECEMYKDERDVSQRGG